MQKPEIGDVVQLFDGPFGTGIVTQVRTSADSGDGSVDVERPHASTTSSGQLQIGIERVTIPIWRFTQEAKLWTVRDAIASYAEVTPSEVCNRCRG